MVPVSTNAAPMAKAAATDSDINRMQQLSRANTLALLAVSERIATLTDDPNFDRDSQIESWSATALPDHLKGTR